MSFPTFRAATLDLITLRRARLDTLPLPDPSLKAALEDLEAQYQVLVNTTSNADKVEIGEFYREALTAFGSNEEIFAQYPDAAGLLLMLRIEGTRRRAIELLRFVDNLPINHPEETCGGASAWKHSEN